MSRLIRDRQLGSLTDKVQEEIISRKYEDDSVLNYDRVISTGSTLLDLAISGGRSEEGGIPGGILVEIFGPAGSGKTAILSECCASAQERNGQVKFKDPEARLNKEYCQIYGMSLEDKDYDRPDTVEKVFEGLWEWEKETSEPCIDVYAVDSLAALSTGMEMEDEDKMGMRRAKMFSEGLRKTCRLIREHNRILLCTNQIRQAAKHVEFGPTEKTPGGEAIPFYSSLRIRVGPDRLFKIARTRKVGGKEIKKVIGIRSLCYIFKSIVDDPYREAPICIIFGYGIDDIRANLQYVKDATNSKVYDYFSGTSLSLEDAIVKIEENNTQDELRKQTIEKWRELESKFKINRRPKVRF